MLTWPIVILSPASPPPEQRQHRRYPIYLDLKYKLLKVGIVRRTGSGRTLNISSQGLLFESEGAFPQRSEIALEINWPFLLDGKRDLKFIVRGHVLRSEGKKTAVRFRSYDFRTSKRVAN